MWIPEGSEDVAFALDDAAALDEHGVASHPQRRPAKAVLLRAALPDGLLQLAAGQQLCRQNKAGHQQGSSILHLAADPTVIFQERWRCGFSQS